MRLYLHGHEYKYAVEQMLLTMFPAERPEYPDGKPEGERLEISLSHTAQRTTACCTLRINGGIYKGRAQCANAAMTDELHTDRVCQRLIKDAIYRAALRSGCPRPAWGALTGVRPGKVLSSLIAEEHNEDKALRRFIREYDVSPARAQLCMTTTRETLRAAASLSPKDICLYVGIPFCPTRCA